MYITSCTTKNDKSLKVVKNPRCFECALKPGSVCESELPAAEQCCGAGNVINLYFITIEEETCCMYG